MSADFSKLTFTANTWPLNRLALTITAAERRVVYEINDENGQNRTADHRCDDAEWTKLESLLAKCNFTAWRKKYKEPALDGTRWHLELLYSDERATVADGLNGYPDQWRDFVAQCEYCEEISEGECKQQP